MSSYLELLSQFNSQKRHELYARSGIRPSAYLQMHHILFFRRLK